MVLAVLAAAAALQYYLVNAPIADLSQTTKFSPATVKAAAQVVSFMNPESDAGSFAFAFDPPAQTQQERMVADGYFDHATLSDETIQKLALFGVHPPVLSAPAEIKYLTESTATGTCATAFQVETTGQASQTRLAEFSQSEIAPSNRHRLLNLKMSGFDSAVTLSSQGTFDASNQSSCKITLAVGPWQQTTTGFIPITVKVPAGSHYRFVWEAVDVQPYLSFGKGRQQSFHAEEVAVGAAQAAEKAGTHDGLVAQAERKDAPLTIDSLLIATDHLQFAAAGKGRAWEDGKAMVTKDLIETINKYPLIAALFGAANLGLLNWAKSRFFPPARAAVAPVVSFLGETPAGQEPESPSKAG
jgi:hypothetical protein